MDERSAAIQQYRKKYLEERKLEVRLKQRKSNALTVCCLSVSHESVCAFSVSYLATSVSCPPSFSRFVVFVARCGIEYASRSIFLVYVSLQSD